MENQKKKDNVSGNSEIDFTALGYKLWMHKKFILKAIVFGLIIGLIVAFSIPKEYTTTVILTPEAQSSGPSSTMSSLAALAGVNLGSGGMQDALASPELYPDVLASTPFLIGLLSTKVHIPKQDIDTTLYSYILDYQKYTWWSDISKAPSFLIGLFIKDNELIETGTSHRRIISKEEMGVINNLRERLSISSDKKTGVTTIEVTMQSPEISAFIADTLTSYLQSYIIDYRTQKARKDLEYAEKLHNETKAFYYKAQQNLAAFIDGNANVISAKYRITQERLQNEANLAYSTYNQTAQQLQLAKIKVQDITPVFTIIQPAIQPLNSSNISKKAIILGFIFLLFIGSSLWVIRKEIWKIWINNE